ncbi:MAG: hypothetical protein IPP48_03455 [Chitinophagaceae bacterium]|nr:hypothetical protein [Chitinophagaceae bacterium]
MTPEQTYNIDFSKLTRWLLPSFVRKPKMMYWMLALATPVIVLYGDFKRYRKTKQYQLLITPQVCYLEKMLNDTFDFTLRRIRIVDAIWYPATNIFTISESKPVAVYTSGEGAPLIIYTDGEAGLFQDDFIVEVPAALVFDENQMKANINIYKLAGTKYKIQTV